MDELINNIHDVIKDYRADDGVQITPSHIENWINQFEETDRLFIAEQLHYIVKGRYLSKENAITFYKKFIVSSVVEQVSKQDKTLKTPIECLRRCRFISHQPKDKSQSELLNIIDKILQEDVGISVSECGQAPPLCFFYVDDILCTGDTIFKGLVGYDKKGWLYKEYDSTKTNLEYINENKLGVIFMFFAFHELNIHKMFSRIERQTGYYIASSWIFVDGGNIDNNYTKPLSSKFQILIPSEEIVDDEIKEFEEQIINKVDTLSKEKGWNIKENYFYRPADKPDKETLFESPEIRNRFEKIILKKSIELYNKAENDDNLRMRPLGYGLKTDKSFGFGTLVFTWRNVPFNTPLVFWYEHKGWQPLFKRKFTTYKKKFTGFKRKSKK